MRILIVEDEMFSAVFLKKTIQNLGYLPVGTVSSGDEALEQTEQSDVDLVLMDINLVGDMDGIEAAKVLKQNYELPVIFITAYDDTTTRSRAMKIQPEDFLTKPFETKELKSAIEKIAS